MNIAERLEQLMEQKGISQSQLSRSASIPYTTLDGIRKRNCDNVKLSTLVKLADEFGISLDYLVGRINTELTLAEVEELDKYKQYLLWRKELSNG